MRKCKYRNCKNEITGRPNKKFCKIQCKRNELKYKQRDKKTNKLVIDYSDYSDIIEWNDTLGKLIIRK